MARGTAPLTARDLAAVTILHAEAQEEGLVARPSGGGAAGGRYLLQVGPVAMGVGLRQVAEALRSRQALPAAPAQWPRAEVVSSLQALADAARRQARAAWVRGVASSGEAGGCLAWRTGAAQGG